MSEAAAMETELHINWIVFAFLSVEICYEMPYSFVLGSSNMIGETIWDKVHKLWREMKTSVIILKQDLSYLCRKLYTPTPVI